MSESFENLHLKYRYRSGDNQASPHDFYKQVLPYTKYYNRAVGFFSSSSFVKLSDGIKALIQNSGKMKLITSPRLNENDIEAIEKGYKAREEVYLKALTREMAIPETIEESNKLSILAEMIETGLLEIKIAVTDNPKCSMYHEKIGLFTDYNNNVIAISGSNNESENAIVDNFESFDVFCGWRESDFERVSIRTQDFDDLWNNKQDNLKVFSFPEFHKEFVKKYKAEKILYNSAINDTTQVIAENNIDYSTDEIKRYYPVFPPDLKLHNYQSKAINNWENNNYSGIFDMATGTGKTLTALSALVRVFEHDSDICAIIICPYIHLVTQWEKDIRRFNINPIIAFGSSPQKNWKDKLQQSVQKRNIREGKNGFFCLVTTIASFKNDYIQNQVKRINKPVLLIADEAHNLGAKQAMKYFCIPDYKYRLGLSATLERHFDDSGTKFLYDFFGEKCIEYNLKQAINEGYLVPYNYYPIVVNLDLDEQEQYINLTKSISKEIIIDKDTGKQSLTEKGKMLCILRSKIIAGCHAKIPRLIETIQPYKDENMILIYCGATKYDEDYYSEENNKPDTRQIAEVIRQLYDNYKFKITPFTASESSTEREKIIQKFSEGNELQAIAAIKCLDEGVNIPSIKTAFILASSTNPKEYIQRRGRVLRIYDGKNKAEIYDFITLPYDIDTSENKSFLENDDFRALAKNEVTRMKEFADASLNKYDSEPLIRKIEESFNLHDNNIQEIIDNYE